MTAEPRSDESGGTPLIRLRMYVAGESPNSLLALVNLRGALARLPDHCVEVEIVDITRDPDRARNDGVLMAPMLVKTEPLPERRVLGNLRDLPTLLGVLGLSASET